MKRELIERVAKISEPKELARFALENRLLPLGTHPLFEEMNYRHYLENALRSRKLVLVDQVKPVTLAEVDLRKSAPATRNYGVFRGHRLPVLSPEDAGKHCYGIRYCLAAEEKSEVVFGSYPEGWNRELGDYLGYRRAQVEFLREYERLGGRDFIQILLPGSHFAIFSNICKREGIRLDVRPKAKVVAKSGLGEVSDELKPVLKAKMENSNGVLHFGMYLESICCMGKTREDIAGDGFLRVPVFTSNLIVLRGDFRKRGAYCASGIALENSPSKA